MTSKRKTLARLSVGLGRRSLGAARVALKTGVAAVRHRNTEASDQRWEQITDELGRMKGLMMKLGQMASYIEGSLPPEAQPILAKLQHQSDPLDYSVVAPLLETTFGAPIETLFDTFERQALAAASIGQVHRASRSGVQLAVKIQYPEIRRALSEDLKSAGSMGQLGMLLLPGGGSDILNEMKERFLEECDYQREAERLKQFGRLAHDIEGASVPTVVPELSNQTVLTMHFVEGMTFQEFCASADQPARDRAAEILARFVWQSVFQRGLFNADPHPGNYILQPSGDVCFLDFGCVKQFEPDRMQLWKNMAASILEDDMPAFRRTTTAMGIVGRERDFNWDAHWRLMEYLYRPFREEGFVYTPDYVRDVYGVMKTYVDLRRTRLPGDMLFTNRLQFGFNSILCELGGQADWRTIFREAVYAPYVPTPAS